MKKEAKSPIKEEIDPYSPRRPYPAYVRAWEELLPLVRYKPGFNMSHLSSLHILCDTIATYEKMFDFVTVNGYVHEKGNGQEVRRPEVSIMSDLRNDIIKYKKILGLVSTKQSSVTQDDQEAEGDFV